MNARCFLLSAFLLLAGAAQAQEPAASGPRQWKRTEPDPKDPRYKGYHYHGPYFEEEIAVAGASRQVLYARALNWLTTTTPYKPGQDSASGQIVTTYMMPTPELAPKFPRISCHLRINVADGRYTLQMEDFSGYYRNTSAMNFYDYSNGTRYLTPRKALEAAAAARASELAAMIQQVMQGTK